MVLSKKLNIEEKKSKMDKAQIRKNIFKYRALLSEKEVLDNSKLIFDKIIDTDWYKNAQTVFLYASYNNEADTTRIIEHSLSVGKRVCCPRVNKENEALCEMSFYEIKDMSELTAGYKGIPEPKETLKKVNEIPEKSIIIIPMVAFDEKLSRVGYGKGFYDRYLNTHKFDKIVGVAFEGQKVECVECSEFDMKPEMIYTEKMVYGDGKL